MKLISEAIKVSWLDFKTARNYVMCTWSFFKDQEKAKDRGRYPAAFHRKKPALTAWLADITDFRTVEPVMDG